MQRVATEVAEEIGMLLQNHNLDSSACEQISQHCAGWPPARDTTTDLERLCHIAPAEPLDSYEKMLNFIRTTNTRTGLVVTAYLDRKDYPTGLKPDRRLISALRLKHSNTLPRWNYTISPNL